MENSKDITSAQTLIDMFDDEMEKGAAIAEPVRDQIAKAISDKERLAAGLPELLRKATDIKSSIDDCDRNIKTWQESKKLWNGRYKSFMDVLETVIRNLALPGNQIKANGVKLATSRRSSLEVDEDWLLGQYTALAAALQQQLPDYVKVSISLDKTRLAAAIKDDDSMLVNYPDKIHTRESTSTSIR